MDGVINGMTTPTVFQTYFPTIGPTFPKKSVFISNGISVEWNQYELIIKEKENKIILDLEALEQLMKFIQANLV